MNSVMKRQKNEKYNGYNIHHYSMFIILFVILVLDRRMDNMGKVRIKDVRRFQL